MNSNDYDDVELQRDQDSYGVLAVKGILVGCAAALVMTGVLVLLALVML